MFTALEQDRAGQGVEPLMPDEQAALDAHLQSCEACRELAAAWQEVAFEIEQAPELEPAPGFPSRWNAALVADRRRLEHRQTMAMLVFVVGAVVLLVGSLTLLSLPVIQTPMNLFWAWLYEVLNLVKIMETVGDIGRSLLSSLPLSVWILFVGVACELAVLWVVSLRVLTHSRGVES